MLEEDVEVELERDGGWCLIQNGAVDVLLEREAGDFDGDPL